GKRWHASWPEPKERVDVPIHVRDVPSGWWGKAGPLDTWEVWVGADPPRMVHVRQPEWLDAHCFRQIGLRTDYRSAQPAPCPDVQPYPKDGLAIAPAQPIERIDVVTPSRPPQPVVDAFNQAERKAIREFEQATSWRHPLRPDARESLDVTVEAI